MSKLLLLPFLVVIACTSRTTSNDESVDVPEIDMTSSAVTKLVAPSPDDTTFSHTIVAFDSSLYIGEVSLFSKTAEIYTPAYFRENVVTEELFNYLHKQSDSVIFEDEEIRRTRIPLPIADKYFNLSGLDTISVYHEADFAGDALFVRVEYMEDLIEGKFIAVFIPAIKIIFPDEPDYCISKVKHQYESTPITYQEIKDEQLTRKLIDTFVLDSDKVWNVLHTRIAPHESVYSAISMHSRLLLIETTGHQSRILLDLKEDWFISEITPTHLQSNGKPVLLFTMGVNETDMMWSAVAVFSGDEYVFAQGNRF